MKWYRPTNRDRFGWSLRICEWLVSLFHWQAFPHSIFKLVSPWTGE